LNFLIIRHQNVSTHICENDLTKVYREHLETLENKVDSVSKLKNFNTETTQCIYEFSSKPLKYTLTPVVGSLFAILLTINYKASIVHFLGGSAPYIFGFAAIYAGLKRRAWLRASRMVSEVNQVVEKLLLNGDKLTVITNRGRTQKTWNLSQISFKKVEHSARTDSFYLIQDIYGDSKYILPIVDGANVNMKVLNWLGDLRRANDDYSIGRVLTEGKFIDTRRTISIRKEIDTLARLNYLSSQGIELSTLTPQEIKNRVDSLSDQEISNYLEEINSLKLTHVPSLESNLMAVQNLLRSFGLEQVEAEKMTAYLREHYKISQVGDLKHLSAMELEEAFSESANSQENFEDFRNKLSLFFK
jgi:hypothetical protein